MMFTTTHATGTVRDPVVVGMVSAYFELVTGDLTPSDAHELVVAVGMLADVHSLLALGRAVRDPMPWQPFLRELLSVPRWQRSERASLAGTRLYAAASALLEQQGLGLVRPEDCLARPSVYEEAAASLMNMD